MKTGRGFAPPRFLAAGAALLIATAFPFLLNACGHPGSGEPPAETHAGDIPVVLVPGLDGSVLVDPEGDVKWLKPGHGLLLGTPDLTLPLKYDGATQGRDSLTAAGALARVSLIPRLIGQEVYAPFLSFASALPGRPLFVFSYDWRRDNVETSFLLERFLEAVSFRHGGKKLRIVAHSMGGILTLSVWNRRADLIESVVFAGVPFRGGIGYLDNMYLGTPIALNSRILSPRVLFSHPSVYSFYPAGQSFESKDLLEDEKGRLIQLDFFDAGVWKRNGFGPYAPQNSAWFRDAAASPDFLPRVLERAKTFRKMLLPPAGRTYGPVLVVMSSKYPTIARARRVPPLSGENVPRWNFEICPTKPGDEAVLYEHAIPPSPIRHEIVLTEKKHSYLLNDPAVQETVGRFLTRP